MSTRCRIAYFPKACQVVINNNKLVYRDHIPSSYCHYDGYVEGVGSCLFERYNNAIGAYAIASAGDFRSLLSTEKDENGYYNVLELNQLEHYEKEPEPMMSDNFIELLNAFKDSDLDYLYVFSEEDNKWEVYKNDYDTVKGDIIVTYLGDLETLIKNLN